MLAVSAEEEHRLVFLAPAWSEVLITLDTRNFPMGIEYGRDWRIREVVFERNDFGVNLLRNNVCYLMRNEAYIRSRV